MKVPLLPEVAPEHAPGPYERIPVSGDAFGENVARATERVGQGGMALGGVLADNALRLQGLRNETTAKEGDIALSGTLTDLQYNPQTGYMTKLGKAAVDGYPDIHQKVQDAYKDVRDSMPNDEARRMFDANAVRRVEYAQASMSSHAAQQNKQWMIDTGKARIANEINTRALAWNDDKSVVQGLNTVAGETRDLLQLQGLDDPDNVKQASAHYQSELLNSSVRQAMAQEVTGKAPPGTAAGMLEKYSDRLDSPHLAALTSAVETHDYTMRIRAEREDAKAERDADHQAARLRVGINQSLSNAGAMVADGKAPLGLPTEREIDAAFPKDPEQAELLKQHVRDLQQVGISVAKLPEMTAKQIVDTTSSLRPSMDDVSHYAEKARLYQVWGRAVEGYFKGLSEDPAGTVASTRPEILGQMKESATNPEAFPNYAQSTLAAQANAGVPEGARSLLPVASAQSLASTVMADPETAPAKLKGMQQQYGSYWPMVLRDLSTVKGGLPPAYQAIASLENERDASLLARWMGEVRKSNKTADDLLGTKPVSDIRTFVRSDPGVTALLSSLSKSGASADQTAGILGAIDDLAFAKSFYDRDPKGAASAIKSFVDRYQFMPQGGARVPTKVFDNVRAVAGETLYRLKAPGEGAPAKGQIEIAIPPIFDKPGMPKKEDYLRTLRASPTWITSPDQDALLLMDPYGRLVRDKAGRTVTVPFDAIPAPAAPVPFNAREDSGFWQGAM